MTLPTNSFTTFSAIGNREDLSDKIYSIQPTDTPFMMLAGRVRWRWLTAVRCPH
jgi:hypothetical protein